MSVVCCMVRSMRKQKSYSGTELIRSTKTRRIQSLRGCDIYQHNISHIAGSFVTIFPEDGGFRDWVAANTFQEAKRLAVHGF